MSWCPDFEFLEATLATLGNAGVLALSQVKLGQQARRLVSTKAHQVWGGQLSGGGSMLCCAVAYSCSSFLHRDCSCKP